MSAKRRSEQATNEPRKRQRTETDPESLRTQVKTRARQLLESLTDFLELFPDNDSTETDRWKIKVMQMECRAILDNMPLDEELALSFEIDVGASFLPAHARQGNIRL